MNNNRIHIPIRAKLSLYFSLIALVFFAANLKANTRLNTGMMEEAFQQSEKKYFGTITDEKGNPIQGVNIIIYDNMRKATTNTDGQFVINAQSTDILIASYAGKEPIKISLNSVQDEVNLVMKEAIGIETECVFGNHGDIMPEFPGGTEALIKFVGSNTKYPKEAQKNKISGRVIVQFVIDIDGSIKAPQVVRSVSPELDAEALRVVKLMPNWKPGMQRGKPVNVKYTIPISFELPKNQENTGL